MRCLLECQEDPELLERIVETYPLGSTVQVQIEDRRAFKRETHKKNRNLWDAVKACTCKDVSQDLERRFPIICTFQRLADWTHQHCALAHSQTCWHNIILGNPCIALVTLEASGGPPRVAIAGMALRAHEAGIHRSLGGVSRCLKHPPCHHAGGTSAALSSLYKKWW